MAENIKIDTNILKQTIQCRDNFSCLSGKKDCLCKVEKYFKSNSSAIFIQPLEEKACNYKMDFGNGWICNCPTRKTLYSEYNI